jgi:23S rRNA (cytosine1962-C5)-methyltransferase
MGNLVKIFLKAGKEQSLLRFHPWVFSGAIQKIVGEPGEGDVVRVLDSNGGFLGLGHYQIGSIMVRVFTFSDVDVNEEFWGEKLQKAWLLRQSLGLVRPDNNAFRLVHGEGDGLPGLIVDMYDGVAVLQAHSVGMYVIRQLLAQQMKKVLGDYLKAVYEKSEGTLPFMAGLEPVNGFLLGNSSEVSALENGLSFRVDWLKGQKTGFFVDQRENRSLIEQYAKERNVLNMFCYTGGFSFYAMRGGAALVHSVDSSERAIELTNENVAMNFGDDSRHKAFAVDAFKFMQDIKDKYDLIVLDPPAFAKHKNVLNNALQGYRKLNAVAIEKIKPGGILFTFSCSQVVTRDLFRKAVFTAAAQSGRFVRILHQLEQPADHPVNIYHPESEYLKGLVLYVE